MPYYQNHSNLSSLQFNENCAPFVDALCDPLFKNFGITHFGCIRMFENGQILRIGNNKAWARKFFENELYNDLNVYNMKHVLVNEKQYISLMGKPNSHHYKMLFEFNIWNFMLIYERCSTYGDIWFFASNRDNFEINNFYINNLNVLHHFIHYFKSKTTHLFEIDDSSKLISTNIRPLQEEYKETINIQSFMQDISYSKHYLSGKYDGKYLSKREAECLFYFSRGNTMKEIAEHTGLSLRTIETYINNIRNKIGCRTKGELVSLFSSVGFLSI